MKKLKVLTWNIGGGKILDKSSDPLKLASYSIDGFEHIVKLLLSEKPDIIALQESHKNVNEDLVKKLADRLGYQYFVHDSTSPSHIDTDFQLGHAIISRYSLSNHRFKLYENPHLEVIWEDGSVAKTFDKGYSTVALRIDESLVLNVTTTHLVPFRRFEIDVKSEKGQQILKNVDETIDRESKPWIVLGDFNIDSGKVAHYFPTAFHEMDEVNIENPTNPKGRSYDHILFEGLSLVEYRVANEVLTDHFPVIATFEF